MQDPFPEETNVSLLVSQMAGALVIENINSWQKVKKQ
jgi:hypothetical protein